MDSTDPRLELLSKWHAEGLLAKAGFTEGTKSELEETTLGIKYSKGNNNRGATANATRNEIKTLITKNKKPAEHHAHNKAKVHYVMVPQGSLPQPYAVPMAQTPHKGNRNRHDNTNKISLKGVGLLVKRQATLSALKGVNASILRAGEFLKDYPIPHPLLDKFQKAIFDKKIADVKSIISQINSAAGTKINPNVSSFEPEQIPSTTIPGLTPQEVSIVTDGRLWAKFFQATLKVIQATYQDYKTYKRSKVQKISTDLHNSNNLFNTCYYSLVAELKKNNETGTSNTTNPPTSAYTAPRGATKTATGAWERDQFQDPSRATFSMAQPFPVL